MGAKLLSLLLFLFSMFGRIYISADDNLFQGLFNFFTDILFSFIL